MSSSLPGFLRARPGIGQERATLGRGGCNRICDTTMGRPEFTSASTRNRRSRPALSDFVVSVSARRADRLFKLSTARLASSAEAQPASWSLKRVLRFPARHAAAMKLLSSSENRRVRQRCAAIMGIGIGVYKRGVQNRRWMALVWAYSLSTKFAQLKLG